MGFSQVPWKYCFRSSDHRPPRAYFSCSRNRGRRSSSTSPPSPPLRSRRNGYRIRSCSSLDRFQTPRHAEYRCLIGELKRFERERGSVNFSSFINSNTSNCRPRCSPSKKIFLPILRRFARSKDCGLWFGVGERKWGGGRRGRVTVFHWDVA